MSKAKAESQEEQLSGLRQQRATMERNLKSIAAKIEQDKQGDLAVVECRAEILEAYFQQICQLQTKIEKIDPDDEHRAEIEDLFVAAKAMISRRIGKGRKDKPDDSGVVNVTNCSNILHQSRLPSLKLPKFDGKYGEYNRFITSFRNLVHEDKSIPVIDKFNYLLSSLSGNALNVVAPFQVSEENYTKALKQLEQRYDKRVLIFLEHITSLFNIQTMPKPDPSSLRTILDTVSALRGSLLSLGSEADVMNAIII
ncbi:uncharacterized protein LOC118745835 [Rhagoletis pomonella]|uniref:uncharacterized protein LOC118745835 n=1 Tax=Rhagoletis pomonella TaxID=28610 RepID=UPI00177EB71A|nr:uncharacterized protein LOC118745835 [Rhagoletis pomonella]